MLPATTRACDWQMSWLETLISLLGIIATTVVAIVTIRKTGEENRLSDIHSEMRECLVESIRHLTCALNLLDDVANKVTYSMFPGDRIVETAYARFWREINDISGKMAELLPRNRLLLPRELLDDLNVLVDQLNEARGLAKYVEPNDLHVYPDTTALRQAVDQTGASYRHFINRCRQYIGSDRLAPLVDLKRLAVASQEEASVEARVKIEQGT